MQQELPQAVRHQRAQQLPAPGPAAQVVLDARPAAVLLGILTRLARVRGLGERADPAAQRLTRPSVLIPTAVALMLSKITPDVVDIGAQTLSC